jgi:hypothetical protein
MSETGHVTEFKRWQAAATPEQQSKIAAEQVKTGGILTPRSNQSADYRPERRAIWSMHSRRKTGVLQLVFRAHGQPQ